MGIGSIVARLLIALALTVQVWAPVGSSRMVVAQVFDPLADVELCHFDPDAAAAPGDTGPLTHGWSHCDLCQLAASGGYTPVEPAVVGLVEAPVSYVVAWTIRVETVVDARFLARIRGRAPPALV